MQDHPLSFYILDCLFQGLKKNQPDMSRVVNKILGSTGELAAQSPCLISIKTEQRHFKRFPESDISNVSEKALGLSKKPYVKQ